MKLTQYRASWGGLARIVFWWALFLWLCGLALPQIKETPPFSANFAGSRLLPMLTENADKRFLRDDAGAAEGKTVAWISDSTTMLFPPGKAIADTYLDEIKSIVTGVSARLAAKPAWEKHRIEYFLQTGLKPTGMLAAGAAAVARKPDVIVVSLNPALLYASFEVFDPHIMGAAALLWLQHPRAWPLLLALSSPHQSLSAILGTQLRLLRQSFVLRPLATGYLAALPHVATDAGGTRQKTFSVRNSPTSARLLADARRYYGEGKDGMRDDYIYRSLLREAKIRQGAVNAYAIETLLGILKDSGIPSLVYLAPMSPVISGDAAANEGLVQAQGRFEALAKVYGSENLKIIPRLPASVQSGLAFRDADGLHLKKSNDVFIDYLARTISGMKGNR